MPPTARFAILLAVVAATHLAGCTGRCTSDFQCGSESYCDPIAHSCRTDCYSNEDCLVPLDCKDGDCKPRGTTCRDGRCGSPVGGGGGAVGADDDGYFDAPGTGAVFVVRTLGIAGMGQGFNLDRQCQPSCVDNTLWPLSQLANGPIQGGVDSGSTRIILEIAGLVPDYDGRDDGVTLKVYVARDADAPVDVGNDFKPRPGETSCCEFNLDPSSLTTLPDGTRQSNTRARGHIYNHRLYTADPFVVILPLDFGGGVREDIRIEGSKAELNVPKDLMNLDEGILGGTVPMRSLAQIRNPYCRMASSAICPGIFPDSTLLDLVAKTISAEADIDLDGDGKECVLDSNGDQTIDLCCDGTSRSSCELAGGCRGKEITPPMSSGLPCTTQPDLRDGYSSGLVFTAVPARAVGFGP